MSGPPPDETAEFFGEMRKLEARAKERGSGLTPDREALAARIFGEETAPDFGESLERLTVALVTLRTAFVPDPPSVGRIGREAFLKTLECLATAAGSPPIVPRGEISGEAPELLSNPRFWLFVEGLRAQALAGDKAASDRLDRVLDVLRVPKRRTEAARAKAAADRDAVARELSRNPEYMADPFTALAVEIARDGKRGPVPLRAVALAVNDLPALVRVRRLEAAGKRAEAENLKAELAAHALAEEGRRVRAAKRRRAKTRGQK